MTGVLPTTEGGWIGVVAGGAVSFGAIGAYTSSGAAQVTCTSIAQRMGVFPNGDVLFAVDELSNTCRTFVKVDHERLTAQVLFRDDDPNATTFMRIVVTANGTVFYNSANYIKKWTTENGLEWGYQVATNQSAESLKDFIAFVDPTTGEDRLFVFVTDTTTHDRAVFEVDLDAPGTNAVGAKMNVHWPDSTQPQNVSMAYDSGNNRIVLVGGRLYSANTIQIILFDPDSLTTAAATNDVQFSSTTIIDSGDAIRNNVAYDIKNDQYIIGWSSASSYHHFLEIDAALTTMDDRSIPWATNGSGPVVDNYGNRYFFNESTDEIICIDDAFTVKWQVVLAQVGVTGLLIKGLEVNDHGQLFVLVHVDSTADSAALLVLSTSDGSAGADFTLTESAGGGTYTHSVDPDTKATLSAQSASISAITPTYDQAQFTSLALDTGTNQNDDDVTVTANFTLEAEV